MHHPLRSDSVHALPLCLGLAFLLAPRTAAQGVPVAVETGAGRHALHEVVDGSPRAVQCLDQVAFLPLELVGVAPVESLLAGRPGWRPGGAGLPDRVLLPQGGALLRIERAGQTSILHVRGDGALELALSVPDAADGPGLSTGLHVALDGSRAIVASPPAAGGDVYLLDLSDEAGVFSPTAGLPPLVIEPGSLRVGASGAWFVADGALWRVAGFEGGPAAPVGLGLAPGEVVLPELAMASAAEVVVAVVEAPGGARRLVHVTGPDLFQSVTSQWGDYETPRYDHPLGPWLAVSPDGGAVAFRGQQQAERLFVRSMAGDASPYEITSPPSFALGIDNIGVIGFTRIALMSFLDDARLAFFTGDIELDDGEQELENGEMFVVDLGASALPLVHNVTQTSGETAAPYTGGGALEFTQAWLDPRGERLLFHGQGAGFGEGLLAFRVDLAGGAAGKLSPPPTLEVLLDDLEGAPALLPAGERLIVAVQPEAGDDDGEGPTELHVLHPAVTGQPAQLELIAGYPEDTLLDRLCVDRQGRRVAFVEVRPDGLERLWVLALETGALTSPLPPAPALSRGLAFSAAGRLYLGVGASGGALAIGSLLSTVGSGGSGWVGLDLQPAAAWPLGL